MPTARISLVLALTLVVAASVRAEPGTNPSPDEPSSQWRTVARWFGNFNRNEVKFATREPGGFGMALSSPHYHQVTSGTVVLREEVDDQWGLQRTVIESLTWSCNVSDMYYVQKDGSRVACGNGGRGSASYAEADLAGEPSADPQQLADARRRVDEASREVATSEREKAEAQRVAGGDLPSERAPTTQAEAEMRAASAILTDPSATPEAREAAAKRAQEAGERYTQWMTEQTKRFQEKYIGPMEELQKVLEDPNATDEQKDRAAKQMQALSDEMQKAQLEVFGGPDPASAARDRLQEAEAKLDSAKENLRFAMRDLRMLETIRRAPIAASADFNESGERRHAHVSINVDDKTLTTLPVEYTGLKFGGHRNLEVLLGGQEQMKLSTAPGISGQATASEDGAATISESKRGGGGSDGLEGGGTFNNSFTISRLPVKQQLMFKGKLYYRIRIPGADNDHNLIVQNGNPISLAGAIPVADSVRVEGRLLDPQVANQAGPPATQPAAQPPPENVADSRNGEFQLALPLKRGKIARLSFVHHSAEAQLTETVTVDVPIDSVINAWGTIGGGASGAPLPALSRWAEVQTRWETKPKTYLLAGEQRGATVVRDGDWHIVQFQGFNSILINTFVQKAPHVNQNRFNLEIVANVPAARLLAARPDSVPEATVRARLGVPAAGPVPEYVTMRVPVKGIVACAATSAAVSLAALDAIAIPESDNQGAVVQTVAQGCYDYYSQYLQRRSGRPMPEIFPFPATPNMINALEQQVANLPETVDGRPNPLRAMSNHLLQMLRRQYAEWPYVEGNEETMKWLISLKGTTTWSWLTERFERDTELVRPWQMVWIVGGYARATFPDKVQKVEWYTETKTENPQWRNIFAIDPKKLINVLGRGCSTTTSIKHMSNLGEGGHVLSLRGAIIDSSGNVVRLIVHDPYGDQSRNPTVQGYYDLDPRRVNRSKYDRDPQEPSQIPGGASWGRYAPYGPDINSFGGTMPGKWWALFHPNPAMSPELMTTRMLPSAAPNRTTPP